MCPSTVANVEDFLVFAQQLARQLLYYDPGTSEASDWSGFFDCDPSAVIAAISHTSPLPIRMRVISEMNAPDDPESLHRLIEQVRGILGMLRDWREGVGNATELREKIDVESRRISPRLCRGLSVSTRRVPDAFTLEIPFDGSTYLDTAANLWWAGNDALSESPSSVSANQEVFQGAVDPQQQVRAAKTQFNKVFQPAYRVLLKVIELAPGYFKSDLAARDDVQPHFGLLIAFLRLYLLLRDDANRLTERHLDFYFRRVLQIKPRPAVADHIHVVVELAKKVAEHKLAAGAELDAGKDDSGTPLRFQVDQDLVANKAQIASLRTVFVGVDPDVDEPQVPKLRAAPVANSGDGLGGPIEDLELPSWPTLGNAKTPLARIGFAIASRALLLAEGDREIVIDLEGSGLPPVGTDIPDDGFVVELTGAKAWFAPDNVTAHVIDGALRLKVTLESTAPEVTVPDAKAMPDVCGVVDAPVVRVTLDQEKLPYHVVKPLRLARIKLVVNASGLSNLIVQNDQVATNPAKPFQPFGPLPKAGSNFYVGCGEAFEKDLTRLTLSAEWESPPASFRKLYSGYKIIQEIPRLHDTEEYQAEVSLRQDGEWETDDSSRVLELFVDEEPAGEKRVASSRVWEFFTAKFAAGLKGTQKPRRTFPLAPWTPATQDGFLRLTLTNPPGAFFHKFYTKVLTRQALDMAAETTKQLLAPPKVAAETTDEPASAAAPPGSVVTGIELATEGKKPAESDGPVIPNEPFTPTIKSLSLSYESAIDSIDSPKAVAFFHLEPFGHRAVDLSPKEQLAEGESHPALLPQFDHEGSLYLGVQDLESLQSLALLFQLAEATADTKVAKPEVSWSYLENNRWVDFDEAAVTGDTTRGLIASGIVTFSIPRKDGSTNTVLPNGLFWLRAAVESRANGVSEAINVHTQAVRATFVDRQNDPSRLDSPLPANSVAGLVRDDAAIAGAGQPYDSFDGRPLESGLAYYTRVSERLRHKGRPITLFDYERIVLEKFPKIYKAKCINHTNDKHALAPGHVLIAVIPDFRKLKAVDRKEPKVTLSDLDAIAACLSSINCSFVRNDRGDGKKRLHVVNPEYEAVRVNFRVQFREDVTAIEFHRLQLADEIKRFLSPWAYEDVAEISFGGRVHKSSILNFVEQRPYVDYVTDFEMWHGDEEIDLDSIQAKTPRSILVPSDKSQIDAITP